MKLKYVPKDWVNCGNSLWRKPIQYSQKGKIYQSTKKYYEKKCINCGEVYLADSLNKTARFCGLSCAATGEFSSRWKGGRQEYGGYVYIWKPNHFNANKRGYVAEHTLVVTKYLERALKLNEQIHHINGKKKDNRRENLIVMITSKHRKFHERLKRLAPGMGKNG